MGAFPARLFRIESRRNLKDMNHDVADLLDLVADRAKGLGPVDRRELAETIVRRLGFSVAAMDAAVPIAEGASRWEARAQELRVHPMRLAQLPDADWDAFKRDIGAADESAADVAPFAGTPAADILRAATGELPP